MTISREEFLRLLPSAVAGSGCREEEGTFVCGDMVRGWRLRLEPLPGLRSGVLVLPRHRVEVRLHGYESAEAAAFLSRFESRFQRGGG